MTQRIYLVNNDGELLLVRADNHASARNFVARTRIRVSLPTQQELIDMVRAGAAVLETRGQVTEEEAAA